MSLNSKKKEIKYLYEIKAFVVAFLLACGLWYVVVGNDHLESNIAVRVEYGSLPDDLIVADGRIENIYVRVKSSTELLKRLDNKDIIYRVALNEAKRGINVIPINMNQIPDLSGFKLLGVDPQYIVMEVDEIKTKLIPIRVDFQAFDEEDFYLSNLRISPSMIEVKGPANLLDELDFVPVAFDLNKVANTGHYARPLQVSLGEHLKSDTPVITLNFDVDLETSEVQITRPVLIHTLESMQLGAMLKDEAVIVDTNYEVNVNNIAQNMQDIQDASDSYYESVSVDTAENGAEIIQESTENGLEKTSQEYVLRPRAVMLTLDVPASKITEDTLELSIATQVEVYIKENINMGGEYVPVQVHLPRHVTLLSVEPSSVFVEKKIE